MFVVVASLDEIPEREARIFEVGSEWIALCKVQGEIYAVEDFCTHDLGPLGEGCLEGYEIECPRHRARFDVRDGAVTRAPAVSPIRCFPVKVENGEVFVRI